MQEEEAKVSSDPGADAVFIGKFVPHVPEVLVLDTAGEVLKRGHDISAGEGNPSSRGSWELRKALGATDASVNPQKAFVEDDLEITDCLDLSSDHEASVNGPFDDRWSCLSTGPFDARRRMANCAQKCVICLTDKEHTLVPVHLHADSEINDASSSTSTSSVTPPGSATDGEFGVFRGSAEPQHHARVQTHRFCTDCWADFLRHNEETHAKSARSRARHLACPVCRGDILVPDCWLVRLGFSSGSDRRHGHRENIFSTPLETTSLLTSHPCDSWAQRQVSSETTFQRQDCNSEHRQRRPRPAAVGEDAHNLSHFWAVRRSGPAVSVANDKSFTWGPPVFHDENILVLQGWVVSPFAVNMNTFINYMRATILAFLFLSLYLVMILLAAEIAVSLVGDDENTGMFWRPGSMSKFWRPFLSTLFQGVGDPLHVDGYTD